MAYVKKCVMLNFSCETEDFALSMVLKLSLTGCYIIKYIHLQYMHVCVHLNDDQ